MRCGSQTHARFGGNLHASPSFRSSSGCAPIEHVVEEKEEQQHGTHEEPKIELDAELEERLEAVAKETAEEGQQRAAMRMNERIMEATGAEELLDLFEKTGEQWNDVNHLTALAFVTRARVW